MCGLASARSMNQFEPLKNVASSKIAFTVRSVVKPSSSSMATVSPTASASSVALSAYTAMPSVPSAVEPSSTPRSTTSSTWSVVTVAVSSTTPSMRVSMTPKPTEAPTSGSAPSWSITVVRPEALVLLEDEQVGVDRFVEHGRERRADRLGQHGHAGDERVDLIMSVVAVAVVRCGLRLAFGGPGGPTHAARRLMGAPMSDATRLANRALTICDSGP